MENLILMKNLYIWQSICIKQFCCEVIAELGNSTIYSFSEYAVVSVDYLHNIYCIREYQLAFGLFLVERLQVYLQDVVVGKSCFNYKLGENYW